MNKAAFGFLLLLLLASRGVALEQPPEEFPTDFPPGSETVVLRPDRLLAGQRLPSGSYLESPDRRYQLYCQDDGNCVIYRLSPGRREALWSTGTRGNGCNLDLDLTGRLRLTDKSGGELWQVAAEAASGSCFLQMQEDGNLVLYQQNGQNVTARWSSQSAQR